MDTSPSRGDVAMYNGSPIFGDHTNIVVQNNDGALVTVGGNEDGGSACITTRRKTTTAYWGMVSWTRRRWLFDAAG